jgi:hypothetical protein
MEFNIFPNEDFEAYSAITEKIKNNKGYCVCSLRKTKDTICICTEFKQSNKEGECHCGRFRKIQK